MPPTSAPLEAIRAQFDAIVRHFDVHPTYKRFTTTRTDDGSPHVEFDGKHFSYVVTERGSEYERRQTEDADDLLYWLVSDTTREAAQKFELKHRVPAKDPRRLLFAKHLELLENVRPAWARRKRDEYDAVLAKHPYDDGRA